jgi:hypothetical protein
MKTVKRYSNIVFGWLSLAVIALALSCSKTNSSNNNNTPPPPPPADATHIYLQDTAFKDYLLAKVCPDAFDKNGRLDVTNAEVTGFTGTMTIDSTYKIQSVAGIAYFTKMSKLIIQNSMVDSLSLPTTMAIDTIRLLANADLQYVNVQGCSNMRYIRFYNIPVTSLDLSNLPALNTISGLSSGRLTTLKVDNDGNLQHLLGFGLTALTTVNTATCPKLQRLLLDYCYAINGLNLAGNTQLKNLIVTNAGSFKNVDLSANPALTSVQFDESGVDTVDFSHNPALFSISMTYTPVRNLSFLSNLNLRVLSLDGCGFLKTVDLRAQTNFSFYFADYTKISNGGKISDADLLELYPDGIASPTPTAICTIANTPQRKFEGASMDLFGGLRVPQYLDASALSLSSIKINDACKNNYSLVMARRTGGLVPQPVVTVYAADETTVTCADYNPELEICN